MIEIDWKGKIGYGDILGPLWYANVISTKNKMDVTLNMFWSTPKGHLFKPEDTESIDQRQIILHSISQPSDYNVYLNQYFDTLIDFNHSNYDNRSFLHNLWFSYIQNRPGDYVVLNSTEKNLQQFSEYDTGKQWKDPIGIDGFKLIQKQIEKTNRVVCVDYSTPIDTLIDLYENCYCAVGYHGSTLWVARYLRCPIVVFSNEIKLSQGCFPWAVVHKETGTFDLIQDRNNSLSKLPGVEHALSKYLQIPNLHRLRSQRT